jgi:hypothetical protein
MKSTAKIKAASGANQGDRENLSIAGSNYISDFQFQITPDVENLQERIERHLRQHRKVCRLVRCLSCNTPQNPSRMSTFWPVCKKCLDDFRGRGPTARNNFIGKLSLNIGRNLRRLANV